MAYRAVFFDRDNTLLCRDPMVSSVIQTQRNEKIAAWSGKPFTLSRDQMMKIFFDSRPEGGHKSVEEEVSSLHHYWREVLLRAGVQDKLDERAEELHQMTWLKGYQLFPETLDVLEWFRANGFLLGVISDTSPSLPLTLEAVGIGDYFDCTICADVVGVMKPDPRIYQTALDALGVTAEESLYVDDYDVEADGARRLGFTAFHLDRGQLGDDHWRINSLWDLVGFVRKNTLLGTTHSPLP